MRVLMVCPELPSASSPGSMAPGARQIQSIANLGIDVDIVDMRGIRFLKYLLNLTKIRRLATYADIIHAHFGYCGLLAKYAQLGKRSQTPIVMSFMGDDLLGTPYNSAGDLTWFSVQMVRQHKRLARHVSQVIVKSAEMASILDPLACTVISNGVDVHAFQPQDSQLARKQLGLDPQCPYILFPGNPDNPRKGHSLATEAVRLANHRLDIPAQLIPLWGIQPDQVVLYMNACNAMLMTSLVEGSPNVVKEAMACNQPVVGVPVGDVHNLLDGVTGSFRVQRDASQIADALVKIIERNCKSDGRHALINRRLDLESVALSIVDIYERVLDSRGALATRPPRSWNSETGPQQDTRFTRRSQLN